MVLKEKKTLHKVLRMLDGVFTPDSTEFSDYVLSTSDDNGFLRTCFCKKKKKLKDRSIFKDCTHIVVGFACPFNRNDLICCWTDDPFEFEETVTKMQISFVTADTVESELDWNFRMGYRFCYVVDLETEKIVAEKVY